MKSLTRRIETKEGAAPTADATAFISVVNICSLLPEAKRESCTLLNVKATFTIGRGDGDEDERSGAR